MTEFDETSDLFGDDGEGNSIFDPILPIKKEQKSKPPQENSELLKAMDDADEDTNQNSSTNNTEKEVVKSHELEDSPQDLEKLLVCEKANSETYKSLNKDLHNSLEKAENELEQVKLDYAQSSEELSAKMSEEIEWNSQKEALKAQLRISQDTIQKLKTENVELGLKSEMESDIPADLSTVKEERDLAVKEKEETNAKLHKLQQDLYLMRSEKVKQEDYILDQSKQLTQKQETISQLKIQLESGSKDDSVNVEEMSATIRKLEKEITRKDEKLSELEDLAVVARRSQRQEQEMKLQEEKIISLERKIETLQRGEQKTMIRHLTNKSPIGEETITPVNEKPTVVTDSPPKPSSPSPPPLAPTANTSKPPEAPSTAAKKEKEPSKLAVITDKQTGKSLRTITLEERIKKFRGSAENVNTDDNSATRHTFRRVSSSGSARSTPSPDFVPRASSEPVSPEPAEEVAPPAMQSLPPNIQPIKKSADFSIKRTYSPQPGRAKTSVDPDICVACGRTAYPIEKITVDKMPYHKFCFKCSICKSTLRPGRHASYEGIIYCLNHFKQEFLGGGGKYPGQVINYVP